MSTNIAAAIEAPPQPGPIAAPYFFTASTSKLVLMSIFTLGIYELYWFYKSWKLIKARTGSRIMPFWRAFFAPIWGYSFFKEIKLAADERNIPNNLSVGGLAAWYFILNILWRLPDPYWLVSILSFLPLIPANRLALEVNRNIDPAFENNDKFSGWNWAALIIGGIFLLFCLFGTFLPDQDVSGMPGTTI